MSVLAVGRAELKSVSEAILAIPVLQREIHFSMYSG